jgi:cytochrome c-type biogenesis protein CcmE
VTDLSPRAVETAPRKRRNNRKWVSIGILVLVLAAGGLVLTKFLTNSLDYYCNVDEVGHKSGCEAGRRLRIQGTVDEGTLQTSNGVTRFDISFNKVTIPVVYDGDPGGLFQECIPVVVHGRLVTTVVDGKETRTFDGDEVEVKHSNDYEAKNPERVDEAAAKNESAACLQQP